MPEIMLYNTATRRKERFEPLDPDNVRMYVCGPTVYDRAHIGNARPAVVFDVLFRMLRHEYGAEHVTYVRNITDVDDKINARAAATKGEGEDELNAIRRITDETVDWYHEDMKAIGNLPPTFEPRATGYIVQMVAMIETLIKRGHAYVVREGSNNPPREYVLFDRETRDPAHTLFEVNSFPEYGHLSGRSPRDMIAGARVEVAPYKRNPMDFVLWKPSDATTPGWDSPWGRGRPGWHIECSAMAREFLGPSFDIHGGGIDLAFPHHENEIAQSRCAHPEGDFAKIWMHNGFLQVEGEKMSKSLGNFFTVWDLRQQMSGMVMRHVLLSSHYRSPLDWTDAKVKEAKSLVGAWINRVGAARRAGIEIDRTEPVDEMILAHLADDLDTHAALQRLNDLARNAVPQFGPEEPRAFLRALDILGFELKSSAGVDVSASFELALDRVEEAERWIDAMARALDKARAARDFTTADRVRTEMEGLGVRVQSTQDGTRWERTADYDPRRILYEAEQ